MTGPAFLPAAPSVDRPFVDIVSLLHASQPQPAIPRSWLFGAGLAVAAVAGALLAGRASSSQAIIQIGAGALLLALVAGVGLFVARTVRQFRGEQESIEAAGELVQLRRWPEAGLMLERYLSRPARSFQLRAQALVYFGAVLARYQRYDDAIAVYEDVLNAEALDGISTFSLRLGRAMAMLHADHLFDADRAISEIRRMSPDAKESGGLGLVELYRDVKTGHPEDALERFAKRLPAMREQLGHRVADAFALVARAYDLLGRQEDAQHAFAAATTLAPPGELFRRYADVAKLKDRYHPAVAPPEAK